MGQPRASGLTGDLRGDGPLTRGAPRQKPGSGRPHRQPGEPRRVPAQPCKRCHRSGRGRPGVRKRLFNKGDELEDVVPRREFGHHSAIHGVERRLGIEAMRPQAPQRRHRRRPRSHRTKFLCQALSLMGPYRPALAICGLIFDFRPLPHYTPALSRPGRISAAGNPAGIYRGRDAERSGSRKRVFRCRPAALQARLREGRGAD